MSRTDGHFTLTRSPVPGTGEADRSWVADRSRRGDPSRNADRSRNGDRVATAPRRGLAACLCGLALASFVGCRQDMHQAPRYNPLAESDFFADKRAARPLVEGTIARGFLREDRRFYTGKEGSTFVPEVPMRVDKELLLRGQDRFNVYCSPCHGRTGEGNGMIVQRGLKQPPSFYTQRLRTQPDGYFYDVIANGFGAMQDYAAQVHPRDRWAIVAYLRTLQFSRNVNATDLSAEDRARLEGAGQPVTEGGAAHGRPGGHD